MSHYIDSFSTKNIGIFCSHWIYLQIIYLWLHKKKDAPGKKDWCHHNTNFQEKNQYNWIQKRSMISYKNLVLFFYCLSSFSFNSQDMEFRLPYTGWNANNLIWCDLFENFGSSICWKLTFEWIYGSCLPSYEWYSHLCISEY